LSHRNHGKHRKEAITDGWYMGPAEIAEIAEILGPSQMAGWWVNKKRVSSVRSDLV
jgi:hypothetical protein